MIFQSNASDENVTSTSLPPNESTTSIQPRLKPRAPTSSILSASTKKDVLPPSLSPKRSHPKKKKKPPYVPDLLAIPESHNTPPTAPQQTAKKPEESKKSQEEQEQKKASQSEAEARYLEQCFADIFDDFPSQTSSSSPSSKSKNSQSSSNSLIAPPSPSTLKSKGQNSSSFDVPDDILTPSTPSNSWAKHPQNFTFSNETSSNATKCSCLLM